MAPPTQLEQKPEVSGDAESEDNQDENPPGIGVGEEVRDGGHRQGGGGAVMEGREPNSNLEGQGREEGQEPKDGGITVKLAQYFATILHQRTR